MAYIPSSSPIKGAPTTIPTQIRKKRNFHVFGFIATTMVVCSAGAAVGCFFYKGYLERQLETVQVDLGTLSSTESERKIDDLRAYDTKLGVAKYLLDGHTAPSHIFGILEDLTKQTVQFESFEYVYDPGFEASLKLVGVTEEFSSLALQKMEFSAENIFSNFIVEGVTIDSGVSESGTIIPSGAERTVGFSITGIFKDGILDYTGESYLPNPVTDIPTGATATSTSLEGDSDTGSEVSASEDTPSALDEVTSTATI